MHVLGFRVNGPGYLVFWFLGFCVVGVWDLGLRGFGVVGCEG